MSKHKEIIKSYIARTLTFNNVVIFTHWCQIHIWFGYSRCHWHWCRFYFLRQNRNFISWLDIVLLHFATRFFQNLEICVKNYKFLQNLTKMCIFSLSCYGTNCWYCSVLSSVRVENEIIFDYLLNNCKQSDVKNMLVEKRLKNLISGNSLIERSKRSEVI